MKKINLSLELILLLTSFLLIITYNFKFPLDADVHFVIKSGEEIWQTGSFPVYDVFSWVPVNLKVPYINVEWLSCLILYLVYHTGGFLSVTIYKTFLYGVSYFILFPFLKNKYGSLPSLLAIIIAIYTGRLFLSPRAMIYSAIFFPIITYMLLLDRKTFFNKKQFLYFFIIFLLWINFHGGFFVGLVYLYTGFVINYFCKIQNMEYKKKKELLLYYLLLMAVCLIATLITPYGPGMLLKTFVYFTPQSIRIFIQGNTEYQSPLSFVKIFQDYFLVLLSGSGFLLFYFFKFRLKPSAMEIYSFIFFMLISLQAVRNIQLFSVAIIPAFSFIISSTFNLAKESKFFKQEIFFKPELHYIFLLLKIVSLYLILWHFSAILPETDPSGTKTIQKLFPVNLKEFLMKNDLPSNLYNHEIIGCYLLFHTYPGYKVSIDTRDRLVYSSDYYIEISQTFHNPEKFITFVDKYKIDLCIMDAKYHPDLLASHKGGWVLLYEEGRYKLYLRDNERNKNIIERFRNDELFYPNIYECHAFLYLNFIELKDYRKARKYLRKLINYYPEDKKLWSYLRELNRLIEEDNYKKGR